MAIAGPKTSRLKRGAVTSDGHARVSFPVEARTVLFLGVASRPS